jgi:hypothetical protein
MPLFSELFFLLTSIISGRYHFCAASSVLLMLKGEPSRAAAKTRFPALNLLMN